MVNFYKEQWHLFREAYWRYFLSIFVLFIASGMLVYFILAENEALVETLMNQVLAGFEEKELLDPEMMGHELAMGLFLNNTFACLLIFLSGFIPIFLPTVGIVVMNGAIIGVLYAYLKMMDQPAFMSMIVGVLPHGIFEIPAIILAGAVAFTVSVGFYKKLGNSSFPFWNVIKNSIKTFVFVCIPLLILAAIIEAFITPLLLDAATL